MGPITADRQESNSPHSSFIPLPNTEISSDMNIDSFNKVTDNWLIGFV